jgi:hypothetical protein
MQALRCYRQGRQCALLAIEARHPECRKQLSDVASAGTFIRSLTAEDVPALFWFGFNLSGEINQDRGSIGTLAMGHLVEKTMERVLELDPQYFHGGAHLVLMAYYGSRPAAAGGDPQKAAFHYRALKEMQPGFPLSDLFYARWCLVQQQDRNRFLSLLNGILRTAPTDDGLRLYERVAARRAEIYLAAVDRLFVE